MKNKEIEEIFNTKLYFDLEEEDYIKIKNYIEQLENNRDKAIEELFSLKDMIYMPETREENLKVQRQISKIIIELKGDSDE